MPKNYLLIFLGVLLFASLISALPKADAAPVVFDSTITLEGAAGTSAIDPSISVAGDLVWVVWVEEIGGAAKIMMKNSTDGGTTFGDVIDLSQNVANTVDPPICPTIVPSNDFNNFDCRGHPQVYANGTNAYVVWQDEEGYSGNGIDVDFLGDVFYRKISFSGSSFTITPALASSPLRINDQPGDHYAVVPVIAASATGPYVHVVWVGPGVNGNDGVDDHVYHSRSVDSGATFTATKTILTLGISGDDSFVMRPDIAVDGSNVYAVWEDQMDAGGPTADILFSASSDNGNIFNGGSAGTAGSPKNLVTNDISVTNTNTDASLHPQIAAAGGNAYVVWDDVSSGQQEIFYRNSTDVGATFGPALSSTATLLSTSGGNSEVQPQIGTNTDGSKVFVTWAENTSNDIKFKRSIDSGVTFAAVQDIDTSGTNLSPKLDSLGDNIYIAWQDTSVGSGDIIFTSSSDGGVTFANEQNLSDDVTLSATPQLDSASSHVVWVDAPGGISNILTQSGVFGLDLSWNATDYRLSEVGTITLLTGSGLGTIDVTVISNVDAGFTKTLTETSTGTYTGSITFSETATTGTSILKVEVGGTITVGKDGTTVNANIFPRTVAWDADPYTKGDGKVGGTVVQFTVTNQHSNVNPLTFENISVTVSSLSTSDVITITANETGIDTGLFKNVNLIFSTGISTAVVGDTTTITQIGADGAGYAGNAIIDTFNMDVKSSTFPTGINLVMTETSTTSNSFTATLFLNSTAPPAGPTSIQVKDGDILSLTYNGATENVMINPTNATVGALSSAVGDTVTATYLTASDTLSITNDGAGGGGGGGVSRAGLTVNALAGLSSLSGGLGGGGTDGSPPITSLGNLVNHKNFDVPDEIVKIVENSDSTTALAPIPTSTFADFDLPLTINDNGYPLGGFSNTIQTFSADIGEPMTITSLYYEQTVLQHVSMYMNLRDNTKGDLSKSDTQILYNKDKPLDVVDPNGFFEKVSVNIIEDDSTIKKFAEFEIIFAKPMETSDIVLRSWDDRLRSMDTIIYDAIEIIDPANIIETVDPEPVEEIIEADTEVQKVPDWIKNNAEWWSQGEVDDTTFKNAIGFLIEKQIIEIPTGPNVSVSTADLTVDEKRALEEEAQRVTPIPNWIKNTVEWWYLGDVSEDEFLKSVEYLVKNGIIEI